MKAMAIPAFRPSEEERRTNRRRREEEQEENRLGEVEKKANRLREEGDAALAAENYKEAVESYNYALRSIEDKDKKRFVEIRWQIWSEKAEALNGLLKTTEQPARVRNRLKQSYRQALIRAKTLKEEVEEKRKVEG
jgi:hypothetical protein